MRFFDPFWKPSFYTEGKASSFWRGFGRLVLVSAFLGLAWAIAFYIQLGKDIPAHGQAFGQQILQEYPDTLEITLKDGQISKNIPGILRFYAIPESSKQKRDNGQPEPTYLVAIDDERNASPSLYRESDAYVLFAKDGYITTQDNRMRTEYYPLLTGERKGVPESITLTEAVLVKAATWFNEHSPALVWAATFAILLFSALMLPFWYLLVAVFIALILMLVSKWIVKKKLSYSESYILTLYALAPVILIKALLLYIPFVSTVVAFVPFLTLVTTLVFLSIMFRKG